MCEHFVVFNFNIRCQVIASVKPSEQRSFITRSICNAFFTIFDSGPDWSGIVFNVSYPCDEQFQQFVYLGPAYKRFRSVQCC